MSYLTSALGLAIAVAGADKLAGDQSYRDLFSHLGMTPRQLQAEAAAELAGGLLMATRANRRLGGAVVAGASSVMLSREIRAGDTNLALARGMVMLVGLAALLAPGRR